MASPTISRSEIDAAKDRVRLPELSRILNLPGEPPSRDGVKFPSPLRPDAHPSCSFYDGGKLMTDWSTGQSYDAIDFLRAAFGIGKGEAIRRFLEIANGLQPIARQTPIYRAPQKTEQPRKPDLSQLVCGSLAAWTQVARARQIDIAAVRLAQDMGTLRFGKVCGYLSWVLLDASGLCAEARRLDGKKYPAVKTALGELAERKAHTLRGSRKDWPVGILPAAEYQKSAQTILVVEGGPDYLAALHFALWQRRTGILPVAILGRGQGLKGLHPDSLEHFRGRRVRIYPHNDPDGGSYQTALRWAKQLRQVESEVDFFVFKKLRTASGKPVKDLNDCCELTPSQAAELEALLP
jgi:hypothetical protein